jgi:hypothetical protein
MADGLRDAGIELILPARSYSRVVVRRVWYPDHGWQQPNGSAPLQLSNLLAKAESGTHHARR